MQEVSYLPRLGDDYVPEPGMIPYSALAQAIRERGMIRKLPGGGYRLYSRKVNPKTGRRRNLGTFKTRTAAEKHERDVQYFKRH